jgi:integrase
MRSRGNEFGVFPKKVHGSVIFYYWVYDENGKRKFRSTGKRTRDEAVKYCRGLQIKNELLPSKTLSFDSYTKDFFDYEKCPYIKYRLFHGHSYGRPWAKYEKRLLDGIIRPHFDKQQINLIKYKDIDIFIMSLKKQNFSHKKINNVITVLKNIFSYAEINDTLRKNPCKGLKSFKVISSEKGILTIEEVKKLIKEESRGQIWPEKIHFIINYLAVSTGLRLGEILALRPDDLSNEKLTISHSYNTDDGLKCTKNGKSKIIPLPSKLKSLLTDLCNGKQPEEYLFSSSNGLKPMGYRTVHKRFEKALESIGIDKEERKRRNIVFHSYRHFVNTVLLQSRIPPETVRYIMGHSGSSMTGHYAHLELPDIFKILENPTPDNKDKGVDNNHVPAYIKPLIDKGVLFPDGKRAVNSLDEVALEMQKLGIRPNERLLAELFSKPDGEKYSMRTCKEAVNYANTT